MLTKCVRFSAPKFTKISIDEFEDAVEEQELSLVMAYVADDDDEEPKGAQRLSHCCPCAHTS